jgi:ABC-type Fe3+-hydroxamate transport system substrate-binding protein
VNLSPELLIAQNPDRIVIAAPTDPDKEKTRAMGEQRARQILNDPRLSGIAAIKNRRVLVVDEDVLLRKGWRVDKLIETFTREFHKP